MNQRDIYVFKVRSILTISCILFLLSIGFSTGEILSNDFSFTTISVNIKNMATASVANKIGEVTTTKKLIEVTHNNTNLENNSNNSNVQNVANQIPTRVWYLPTEYGTITSYPSYGHFAYDITSPRGSSEIIYPVADGIISGIYRDSAGALVVTIRHIVDGRYYSSQYAHLSRYANIYVGQNVTPFTPLGWMGTTGISTGVHLHVAVLDCNLFSNTDMCSNLNGFMKYGRIRYSQGFRGLGSVINMPYQWYSR